MSMELLGNEFIEEFYQPAEAKRARRVHLEGVVGVFPWIATVDAFQHWIYSHPGHTRDERRQAWLALMDRFGGDVDWSGFESARANLWHRQLHIFLHPFYYIEYGIAQIGALQVWANSKRDKAQALNDYKKSLTLGGFASIARIMVAAAGVAAALNSARKRSNPWRRCYGKSWQNCEVLLKILQPIRNDQNGNKQYDLPQNLYPWRPGGIGGGAERVPNNQ